LADDSSGGDESVLLPLMCRAELSTSAQVGALMATEHFTPARMTTLVRAANEVRGGMGAVQRLAEEGTRPRLRRATSTWAVAPPTVAQM
jgi:hypothetical protein